jgi:signal transduction histidine kinase
MSSVRRVTVTVLRAPFTRRARLDLRFCVISALSGVLGFVLLTALLVPSVLVSGSVVGTVVGLVGVVTAIRLARLLAALHRRVLRLATAERLAPMPPFRPGSGPLGRLDRRLRDRNGWRAVGYTVLKLPLSIAEGYAVAAVGFGLVTFVYPLAWALFRNHPAATKLSPMVAAAPVPHGHWAIATIGGTWTASLSGIGCVLAGVWLARGVSLLDIKVTRAVLGPSRVSELERTRALAVEDASAVLRRVERDLHDGAQVRLAAVTMNLGLARERAAADDTLRELLDAAQTGVSGALADLRRIARGIHPPALDTGLYDALASLAATSPIPARVQVDLPRRPSPAIETMAYFCIAELLANAIKHSSASAIEISVRSERTGVLQIRHADDGTGGADPARGSGLRGLAQRASTVDGTLHVSSPPGGPTTVTVELPLRLPGFDRDTGFDPSTGIDSSTGFRDRGGES